MRCFGDKTRTHHCKVVLLDEQELIQEVQDTTSGQDLLDVVLQHLNLLETAYFGLRFLDLDNQTHWLDPAKRLVKQLKGTSPFTLYFSVKFYAADPTKLVEEITRYQFFLQVKQDILQGRLPVPLDLAAELGAYAVQSELGDYDPRRHSPGYVSEFRFIAGQAVTLETRIADLHKKLVGQVPAKAELSYLEKIKWLDMYGVDLHPVLGEDNIEYFLGLTPSGAIVLRNKTKVGNYFWPRITKVYFRGRFFMLRVRDKNNSENTYGFETPSRAACKHLWQCCVEHHAFFRLTQTAGSGPQAVFSLGSKFRYSGRTEREAAQEARQSSRQQPEVTRTPSRRYQRRVVEGAADTPRVEDADPKIDPRPPVASVASLTTSNVYRSTSLTLNGRGASSPRSIRSAPHQASSSVPPFGRHRAADDASLKSAPQRTESRPETRCGGVVSRAESPRSVRSAAPAVAVDPVVARRTSSVDSQSSVDSRGHRRHRRRSRCRSSDGESEASSKCSSKGHHHHHHRHRHHHRHHSDDSSEHQHKHKHRRHRHKSTDSSKNLVESEEQWARVQAGECKVKGNTATVRDLSSRSGYAPSVDTETGSQHHSSNKRRHRKHRSRSRSPTEAKNSRYPAELRRHIDYGLQDTSGLTEAELKDIPYTRVETATNVKTKYATTSGGGGGGRKHKSPRRSKSNSSDRKLTPPDGESPPPTFQDSSKSLKHHNSSSSSRRKSRSSADERPLVEGEQTGDSRPLAPHAPCFRTALSGESSTPPPPPSSVPPAPQYGAHQPSPSQYGARPPSTFPGYVPNGRHEGTYHTNPPLPPQAGHFGSHKPAMINGPSIKSLVTGHGLLHPHHNQHHYQHKANNNNNNTVNNDNIFNHNSTVISSSSNSSNNSISSSSDNNSPSPQEYSDDHRQHGGATDGFLSGPHGFISPPAAYLKQSTLERGTRGSAITKPQPSPQSSVTSGISVGGSSVSTSAESALTAASHKAPLIRTSDMSTSPSSPSSSSSPPPNDRDTEHVFYNPCNSIRTHSFFTSHASELYNSSSPSANDDSTLDDSHDALEPQYTNYSPQQNYAPKPMIPKLNGRYPNVEPYAQHSTNILIRYHDTDRPGSRPDSNSTPTPIPRSSIISSVLSNDTSTHIVQSYGPAYANTYFSNSASTPLRPSSNPNVVGIPVNKLVSNPTDPDRSSAAYPAYGVAPSASTLPRPSTREQLTSSTSQMCQSPNFSASHATSNNLQNDLKGLTSNTTHSSISINLNRDEPCNRVMPNWNRDTAAGGNWRLDKDHIPGSNSNCEPQMKDSNWEMNRSTRGWTNTLGRAVAPRPSHGRQASTTIMEEEEPPPSLPPRFSPPLPGGTCVSNGNLITTVTENNGPAAGHHSRPQLRPPVPANKPSMPQPRPHSVHGEVGQYNLNSCGNNGNVVFPNGSIITQITDQDGYRATRVPLNEAAMAKSRKPDNLNAGLLEGTDNMRYSSPRHDGCANSNGHVNGSGTLLSEPNNYQKINSYVNNNIGNPSSSDELSAQTEHPSRYSYPNQNGNSEGVLIRNMINKSGVANGVVGGMIARLNGSPVSMSNGNPHMQATNGGAPVTFSNKQENFPGARNNNDCEEVSTEL